MPKSRAQKQTEIQLANERFQKSKSTVLVTQTGVSVKAIEKLRGDLRANHCELQGVKKSLLKLFVKENGLELTDLEATGTVGLMFSYDDEVSAAKLAFMFGKEQQGFQIAGGFLEKQALTKDQVLALAKLPGKQELLAQLVWTLNGTASQFVRVLAGPLNGFANVLRRLSEQKN